MQCSHNTPFYTVVLAVLKNCPNVAQYNNKIPMNEGTSEISKILNDFRIDYTNTQNKFSKDMMELQVTFISQCMKETIEKLFPLEVV